MTVARMIGCILTPALFAVSSCNETLPVRDEGALILSATLTSAFHREVSNAHYLRFLMTVKNTTDETIEERLNVRGTVHVRWEPSTEEEAGRINRERTMNFTNQNIFRAPGYDPMTGILQLDPGDSIMFYVSWNMKSNDSTYLPGYWSNKLESSCYVIYGNGDRLLRRIYPKQYFTVSASVKMFDQLAVIYAGPTVTARCFVAPYSVEANPPQSPCGNINIVDPCSLIGE